MKRYLLLILALIFIILLFIACGSQTAGGNTTEAPTSVNESSVASTSEKAVTTATETTAKAGDTLKPYVITYNLLSNEASEDKELVEEAINKIIEPLINATVKFNMITWADWDSKANVPLQAGEIVDITFTADWWNYVRSVAQNQFLPLNDPNSEYGDLLNTYAPEAVAGLGESFLKGVQLNGINYSIPTNKELTVPGAYHYNQDIVEKYKIDISKILTDDDIEPWLEIVKEGESDDFICFPNDGAWTRGPYIQVIPELSDYRMINDAKPDGTFDETIYFIWEDPVYMEHFKKMREWYLKGYIHPDAYLDNHSPNTITFSGKYFFTDGSCKGFNGVQAKEIMAASGNPNLRIAEFVTRQPVYITLHAGGSMLAVPYTSGDPARAVMYINLMHSHELLLNTMVWGVEGRNYEKIGPKQVKQSEVTPWITKHGGAWTLGNQIGLQWVGAQEDPDKYANMSAFNATGKAHVSLGFRFDTTNVDSEIIAYNNARSMARSILVGAVDPMIEVPKMLEAMKAAGSEKIKDELNKQFSEWLSHNRR